MASVSISAKVKLSGRNLGRDEIAPVDSKAGGESCPCLARVSYRTGNIPQ
jgi:hypothetical protein